jgi:hypothetical protein
MRRASPADDKRIAAMCKWLTSNGCKLVSTGTAASSTSKVRLALIDKKTKQVVARA